MILLAIENCAAADAAEPLADSRQCLVVVTDSWNSTAGVISTFQRGRNSRWMKRSTFPVVIGKAGLAWGRGLIDTKNLPGPRKREGDDKAPAGIFRLTDVFGWEKKTKMPFLKVTPHLICVDDPKSRYYNRVFNELDTVPWDWRHAERLSVVGSYRMGVIVEQNMPPERGHGSCIFLHIWKSPTTPTSGCTAMAQETLIDLIHWLDPAAVPVLIQLPRSIYGQFRAVWNLP